MAVTISPPLAHARRKRVVPGFGLSLGITLTWLSLIVLIPLAGLFVKAGGLGVQGLWDIWTQPRVLAALNGFDERLRHETPNPGDAAFAAEVAQWRQTKGVSEVQAVLYRTLCEAVAPSAETQWLLEKVQGKRHKGFVPAAEVKQWLAVAASQLLGVK